MNPLSLRLENVGRFPHATIEFPAGTVAVTGPNGAGKSTILNAVELALFADGSRDLAGCLGPHDDRLEIELVFEHAGDTFRVRRGYRRTGARGQATLDFERLLDPPHVWLGPGEHVASWEPLTRERADATQQLICDTLGLSRQTFNASAFLGQGNAGAFPDASPADRKAMLGEILDPHGLWPALCERARGDARTVEADLNAAAARIAGLQAHADQVPAVERELAAAHETVLSASAAVAAAEQRLDQAQQKAAANLAAAERVKAAAAEVQHARERRDSIRRQAAEAQDAAAKQAQTARRLADLEQAAAGVEELEQAAAAARAAADEARQLADRRQRRFEDADRAAGDAQRIRAEGDTLSARHQHLAARHAHLKLSVPDAHDTCQTCGQTLKTPEARQMALASLTTELDQLEEQMAAKARELAETVAAAETAQADAAAIVVPDTPPVEALARSLAEAQQAAAAAGAQRQLVATLADRAAHADTLLEQLRAAAADVDERDRALAELAAGVADQAGLEQAANDARRRLAGCRQTLEAAAAASARCEQRLEQLRAAAVELGRLQRDVGDQQDRLDLLRLAERAYGRDGIPTLVAENVAIPQIEAEANRILEQLPTVDGVTFHVELRTQRALKTDSDRLRETLDIVVSDTDGDRPFETFSGGERARLNIALRIALARLLANRRGAESRLLAIDELEYLDELGQEKLVEVLRGLADTYDRVLVVSHAPGVRDAFDATVEVVKADGVSRVAGAPARLEAVPA